MKAIVLGLVAHLAACTTAPAACAPDDLDCEDSTDDGGKADGVSAASGAQMNDMTIVVPLAKTQAEADAFLAATTPGIGGALLSKTLYTKQFPDPTGTTGVGADVQM